jgi:hypothetical protein
MATAAPKTPERSIDEVMEDLTLAPRKKHGPSLTRFLHEPAERVEYVFHLSGGRACMYNFDKNNREVRLSNVDGDEKFTTNMTEDPDLMFTERDWILFYTKVWRDLKDGGDEPLFIAEWSGLTMGTRYRLLADHVHKYAEDYIYILCSDFGKDASACSWPITESEHLEYYDLKFMFQWKDLPVLEDIFSKIHKLFQWSDAYERYKNIKVKLFHPEWCTPNRRGVHIAPPTLYKH